MPDPPPVPVVPFRVWLEEQGAMNKIAICYTVKLALGGVWVVIDGQRRGRIDSEDIGPCVTGPHEIGRTRMHCETHQL